jgi:hypothetical protein
MLAFDRLQADGLEQSRILSNAVVEGLYLH